MSATRCVLAVVVGTIALVLWYGLVQLFPWGTGSVSNFSATSSESYATGAQGLEVAAPLQTLTGSEISCGRTSSS